MNRHSPHANTHVGSYQSPVPKCPGLKRWAARTLVLVLGLPVFLPVYSSQTSTQAQTGRAGSGCPPLQPAPTGDTKCFDSRPGCLDPTFGSIGFVHLSPGGSSYTVQANGVAVQADGKIVVAGTAKISSTYTDFAVIRYNVDGTLDKSFGDPDPFDLSLRRGYTVTAITSGADNPYGLVLQPDGKIVVCGAAGGQSVVVRYKLDGTVDTGFGSGGIAHLGSSAPTSDVRLQADGKIVVGGAAGAGFALARLNTTGSFDSTFGAGGQVSVNPSGAKRGSAAGWGLAVQRVPAITGEERIVLAGWSQLSSGSNSDWTLMRFRSNGATDTSFGTNGIVKTAFSGFGDQARKVRIDSSNRIVAGGIVRIAGSNCEGVIDSAVVRYTQNGSLDGSFAGGRQIVDVYGGDDNLYGLALQANDKVVIFGTANSSDNTVHHFSLVRFNVDGSRDFTFGLLGNGVVTTDLYGLGSYSFADLALDPTNGKIVAAGGAYYAPSTPGDIAVARYWP